MRDVARAAAFAVALLVVGRNVAVAGTGPAMVVASMYVLLLVAAALGLWRDGMVTVSGVALAGHYGLSLGFGHVAIDLAAPVVGALILLYIDLADLAASIAPGRQIDRALLRRTLRGSAALFGAATLTGAVVFAFAAGPWPSAEWVRAAGALGVGVVVLVPFFLVRRS